MDASDRHLKELLNSRGLKATSQRIAVFSVLYGSKSHPSAEQIMQTLAKKGVKMPYATVYNVLDALSSSGLVRKIYFNNDVMRFDPNTSFHIHVGREGGTALVDCDDEEICSQLMDCIKRVVKTGKICNVDILVSVE